MVVHGRVRPASDAEAASYREEVERKIFRAIEAEGVTHFCGAPVVLNMVINAKKEDRRPLPRAVQVMTAAALLMRAPSGMRFSV